GRAPNSPKAGARYSSQRAWRAASGASGRWQNTFTPKGRSVSARVCAIMSRATSAELDPSPSEPRPPALDTAAASAGVLVPAMGAWMTGTASPRRAGRQDVVSLCGADMAAPKKLTLAAKVLERDRGAKLVHPAFLGKPGGVDGLRNYAVRLVPLQFLAIRATHAYIGERNEQPPQGVRGAVQQYLRFHGVFCGVDDVRRAGNTHPRRTGPECAAIRPAHLEPRAYRRSVPAAAGPMDRPLWRPRGHDDSAGGVRRAGVPGQLRAGAVAILADRAVPGVGGRILRGGHSVRGSLLFGRAQGLCHGVFRRGHGGRRSQPVHHAGAARNLRLARGAQDLCSCPAGNRADVLAGGRARPGRRQIWLAAGGPVQGPEEPPRVALLPILFDHLRRLHCVVAVDSAVFPGRIRTEPGGCVGAGGGVFTSRRRAARRRRQPGRPVRRTQNDMVVSVGGLGVPVHPVVSRHYAHGTDAWRL